MGVVRAWEVEGVTIPSPYQRVIKVLMAPDANGVDELTFSHAILAPFGQTDSHRHDRGELIYIVAGRGQAIIEGKAHDIEPDTVFWAPAGVEHQVKNLGPETMKLATVFVPAYTAQQVYGRCVEAAEDAKQPE